MYILFTEAGNLMKKQTIRNAIIYIFLVTIILAGSKYRLEVTDQVLFLYNDTTFIEDCIELADREDCLTLQVRSAKNVSVISDFMRCSRNDSLNRYGIQLILCMLIILLAYSIEKKENLLRHSDKYVYRLKYNVTFMQAEDGRKRTLIFCQKTE